ncbi:MAG TPA: hypothetical protein VNK43_01865 [Gemmatimonadales bacterium]|nr:hypothetical protein [Gemmatimonadales bacterium]
MEDILALILIFGGGAVTAISFSPVGRALAERIRGSVPPAGPDPAVLEELDRLRMELTELQERMDFAERLLTRGSAESPPVEGS